MTGVEIEGGFARVGDGEWLVGPRQPAVFSGAAVRKPRRGWRVPDRQRLSLVAVSGGAASCSSAAAPFVTFIPCAAPVNAVSSKVLVAPARARTQARIVRPIPMSAKGAFCVTEFGSEWVVLATASRAARFNVDDGDTLSVRPEALAAWTGPLPTGFCPRLGILDMLLPRRPKELLLHFHGPCIVWAEGSAEPARTAAFAQAGARRAWGGVF